MSGGIFLLQEDGKLVEMREKDYDSEDLLQGLLADYPNLLAGDQINSEDPRRWLLVRREAPIPLGEEKQSVMAVDHLFLDHDAIPTLIEVKRSSDTRMRREVVGQMLDYAANAVVNWQVEEIRARFEANVTANNQDPQNILNELMKEDIDPDEFWSSVKTNLETGNIRLVFVADDIPTELRLIIEFLNKRMSPTEVIGVEVKQFVGEGMKTLVPRVIGITAETERKKRSYKSWDEKSVFEELEKSHSQEEVLVARKIYEWGQEFMPDFFWGRGKQWGSVTLGLDYKSIWHQAICIYTNGYIELQFQYMKGQSPFDVENNRKKLWEEWNKIPGSNLPGLEENVLGRRPSIPLFVLVNDKNLSSFLKTLAWFVEEVKSS